MIQFQLTEITKKEFIQYTLEFRRGKRWYKYYNHYTGNHMYCILLHWESHLLFAQFFPSHGAETKAEYIKRSYGGTTATRTALLASFLGPLHGSHQGPSRVFIWF